jgi:STAM-binding protein
MSHPSGHHSSRIHRRPATIPELAERALLDLSDDKAKLKDYLRIAEKYRKEGKELAKQGDLEAAFVLLAKAATLVLERLPKHRDYTSLLNDEQQNNLALVCILSPPPQSIHRRH